MYIGRYGQEGKAVMYGRRLVRARAVTFLILVAGTKSLVKKISINHPFRCEEVCIASTLDRVISKMRFVLR
jgi:hypothetical protein